MSDPQNPPQAPYPGGQGGQAGGYGPAPQQPYAQAGAAQSAQGQAYPGQGQPYPGQQSLGLGRGVGGQRQAIVVKRTTRG